MNLKATNRKWFIITLLLGTFTMSISQSALSTAYPTFMTYFHLPASTVAWLTTGFMLVMSVVMPLSPWLLNNIKFKNLYISLLINFLIGTLIIIWAPNFLIVMLGRLMEAVSVGILFPSYQSIILEITPIDNRGTTMGLVGLVMGAALATGPIVSGVLLQFFHWQSIFVLFTIILLVVTLLALKTISSPIARSKSRLDFISVFLSTGIIGLLFFINEIPTGKIGPMSLLTLAISLIFIILFILRQLRQPEPLLHLAIMKNRNFNLGVILTALSYMSLITVTVIMPLYYQEVLHLSPLISGLALVPAAALLAWLNRRSGKMADRSGFKIVLYIGFGLFIIGWLTLLLNLKLNNLWVAIIATAIVEAGNSFVMMPATTLGANSLATADISHGSSIIATVRQILGSTAVVIATVVLGVNNFAGVFLVFLLLEIIGLGLAFYIKDVA